MNADDLTIHPRGSGVDGRSDHQPKQPEKLPVVGIGASAGGLQALKAFFGDLPAQTGIAFVVVVHLSPEHESSMAELLQAQSELHMLEVTGRTRMQPDHVYVIPPGKNIEISDGYLDLAELEGPRLERAPIDHFFRTLAYAHPDGIGILLSGGGADGTVGLKSIKEQGGILMAQDPEEAEHDSMPRNAINTGLVDFVLPVKELARKALELSGSPDLYKLPEKTEELPESEEGLLHEILAHLQDGVGHDFSGYKRSTVLRRIERRMRVNHIEELSEYLGFVRGHKSEPEALFRDLLISVTNFFRDPTAWEGLEETVIPKLFEHKKAEDEIRVWVPGCATGEEAYSVAMLLLEQATVRQESPRIQVFASDLDEAALLRARDSLYPEAIATDLSEQRIKRFFIKRGDHYQVKPEVRNIILFASHNLLKDPPFHNLDLIACRNLLIYLRRPLQEKIFDLFHYALRPNGYLLLGQSESAESTTELFVPFQKKHRIYQRRAVSGKKRTFPDMPLMISARPRVTGPSRDKKRREGRPSAAEMHFHSLEQYAPPSVLVDENRDILHLSPTAGRYLHYAGGHPTHNILRAVHKGLQLELSSALQSALEDDGKPISTGPVEVTIDGQLRLVHVIVRPADTAEGRQALVIFAETDLHEDGEAQAGGSSNTRVLQLEQELRRNKEQLRTAIEEHDTSEQELKAANEELQSINEEYKSTLEELETSKEELQSVNEELQTVNAELQGKVEELTQANNDLNNLMASTEVATIFLNRELKIERFTPSVNEVFNIRESDKGRPISHLTHRFVGYNSLIADAEQVLDSLVPVEHEVQDTTGRWYLARILPYRTSDDRIEGVVVTFVDITRLKTAEEQKRLVEERHRLLLERLQEYAIFTMDEDGTIATWNPGAERLFGYTEEEALGQHARLIFVEDDRTKDAAESEMEEATRNGQASDERWHLRKDGSRFWGSGVLTALHDQNGTLRGYAKVLRDNTRRRESTEALKKSQKQLQEVNQKLEERVSQLQRKSEQVRKLASDLIIAEQDERHRIAQMLHDDLQQQLYGIQMRVVTLSRTAASSDPDELKEKLEETNSLLQDALQQTRTLAVGLSPPVLQDEGLAEAANWLASQMQDLHKLHVEVQADEAFYVKNHEMRVLLFQILRELLFNVVKHAETNRASVELKRDGDHLCMRVSDKGTGFDSRDALSDDAEKQGFGLRSIQERVGFFEGNLDIKSSPEEGTEVTITILAIPQD